MEESLSSHKGSRLCITADDVSFDEEFIRDCKLEGFEVVYLPFQNNLKDYARQLNKVKEGLNVRESYGVIGEHILVLATLRTDGLCIYFRAAFGEAAAFCLDHYLQPPNNTKLCALVAYYPTNIPDPEARFPQTLHVLVHFSNQIVNVKYKSAGPKRKQMTEKRHISTGRGTGDRLPLQYLAYAYSSATAGFAERDMEQYDQISADLAWSRTVRALQVGFQRELDLEKVWDDVQEGECCQSHSLSTLLVKMAIPRCLAELEDQLIALEARYFSSKECNSMASYVKEKIPLAIYAPSLQGGSGSEEVRHFYKTIFGHGKPPSMNLRLLSRTVGVDRIVDELYMGFDHSQRMDWILPGIQPTNRHVEVILISIVCLRGGKIYSEHTHWDQASVLTQVGLLNPKLVPQEFQGAKDSLFIGSEAARAILSGPGQCQLSSAYGCGAKSRKTQY